MNGKDFYDLIAWQREQPGRSVMIAIDHKFMSDEQEIKAWVYDYALRIGQFVTSADEIDLEGLKDKEYAKQLAEWWAKKAEIERWRRNYGEANDLQRSPADNF